jgi:hypothetical protein
MKDSYCTIQEGRGRHSAPQDPKTIEAGMETAKTVLDVLLLRKRGKKCAGMVEKRNRQ